MGLMDCYLNGTPNKNCRMLNDTYSGVRGRKMKVGSKLLCFPSTRLKFF